MSNIQIPKRDFDVAKNKIQSFANTAIYKNNLPTLKTSQLGILPTLITGSKMNEILKMINNSLIQQNQHIVETIRQFGTVYNTFETLDKEYIQNIITIIEAADVASRQAKTASNDALSAQKDIKRIIEALKISVSKLEKTKEEFFILKDHFERIEKYFFINSNGITQLKNIEEIAKKVDEQELGISLLTIKFNNIEEAARKTYQGLKEMIDELQKYHFQLKKLEHLIEVDSIWEDVNTIKLDLANQIRSIDNLERYTQSSFSKINEEILILKEYKFELKQYNHLKDIDEIWENTEKHHRLLDFLDTQLSQTKVDLTNLNSAMTKSFQETHTEINSKSNLFEKRLRIAYWVAGGALFLALLQFVLLMFKVL